MPTLMVKKFSNGLVSSKNNDINSYSENVTRYIMAYCKQSIPNRDVNLVNGEPPWLNLSESNGKYVNAKEYTKRSSRLKILNTGLNSDV